MFLFNIKRMHLFLLGFSVYLVSSFLTLAFPIEKSHSKSRLHKQTLSCKHYPVGVIHPLDMKPSPSNHNTKYTMKAKHSLRTPHSRHITCKHYPLGVIHPLDVKHFYSRNTLKAKHIIKTKHSLRAHSALHKHKNTFKHHPISRIHPSNKSYPKKNLMCNKQIKHFLRRQQLLKTTHSFHTDQTPFSRKPLITPLHSTHGCDVKNVSRMQTQSIANFPMTVKIKPCSKSYLILNNLVCNLNKTWAPFVTIGVGTSTSSDIGRSQNFPIQNPITDQFYNYSSTESSQTSALIDGFFGVEWRFHPQWKLQSGLAYNQSSPFISKGTFLQGADTQSADTFSYEYHVVAKQLLLEEKLLYTVNHFFHPYLLGGLGVAFNSAYNYSTNVPPFLTFTRLYANNTSTAFSYRVGLGVDADITSFLRLGIGYRFTDLGKVKLGTATIDTTNVSGTLCQSHFYTNQWLAEATWLL